MSQPKGVETGIKRRGVVRFAFLAIAAAVVLAAQPFAVGAAEKSIKVKEADGKTKTLTIKYDAGMKNISATTEDGKTAKITDAGPFPIQLGDHTRKIAAVLDGPMIVFEGSTCVLIGGRWIAYPPGTPCP